MKDLNSIKKIVQKVFKVEMINSKSQRSTRIETEAKYCFSKICRDATNHPYRVIAEQLNRDHSTVIHYKKSCNEQLEVNKDFLEKYVLCLKKVNKKLLISSREEKIEALQKRCLHYMRETKKTLREVDKIKKEIKQIKLIK